MLRKQSNKALTKLLLGENRPATVQRYCSLKIKRYSRSYGSEDLTSDPDSPESFMANKGVTSDASSGSYQNEPMLPRKCFDLYFWKALCRMLDVIPPSQYCNAMNTFSTLRRERVLTRSRSNPAQLWKGNVNKCCREEARNQKGWALEKHSAWFCLRSIS